jgi:hypothetical protein
MSTHTPGPWLLASDAQGPCMVMHPTLRGVAIANLGEAFVPANGYHSPTTSAGEPCAEAPTRVTHHGERVANARLVAAAPDLLAALREVVAVASAPTETAERDRHDLNECFYLARAAIAKAEGRAA